jgi:hypothetical protein
MKSQVALSSGDSAGAETPTLMKLGRERSTRVPIMAERVCGRDDAARRCRLPEDQACAPPIGRG